MAEATDLCARFQGQSNQRALLDALDGQALAVGSPGIGEALLPLVALEQLSKGQILIEQGAGDNDIFFILAGALLVTVNGREIAIRKPGESVGEMAATMSSLPRSATVTAIETSVVARLTSNVLVELGDKFPRLWQELAKDMARRLFQRNRLVNATRDRINVFIISSAEALPVARAIQNNFAHDAFFVKVWPEGVFRASQYPVESLEAQLDQSDFAIAVAQGDDQVLRRDASLVTARDNVIFELGLFVGRLGRQRSFLVEPKGGTIKLPSDLAGIITLPYKSGEERDLDTLLGPACNKLREIFRELGPT